MLTQIIPSCVLYWRACITALLFLYALWYILHMNIGFVETDWQRNIRRVSPFLGIILVGVFSLFMFTLLNNAMKEITQVVNTEAPLGVTGTIRLEEQSPVPYGSKINFRSTVDGVIEGATTFITVACFQADKLVYQRSAQQGVAFFVSDQYERDLVWDGTSASCSATLMYRKPEGARINLHILDGVSFNVAKQ